MEALLQTIRDAVEVTLQIGLNHLWVDAICTVQNCEADWETEFNKDAGRLQPRVLHRVC
jgi:hypothetical protein